MFIMKLKNRYIFLAFKFSSASRAERKRVVVKFSVATLLKELVENAGDNVCITSCSWSSFKSVFEKRVASFDFNINSLKNAA